MHKLLLSYIFLSVVLSDCAQTNYSKQNNHIYSLIASDEDEAIYSEPISDLKTELHVTAFPNPFSDRLTISFTGPSHDFSVLLYDVSGRPVFSADLSGLAESENTGLDLSFIAQGVYYLRVTDLSAATVKIISLVKY